MILYYTGTGNSEYAAQKLSKLLHEDALDLFTRIRGNDHRPLESDTPWVIVAPTYAWRLPRVVCDFLLKTPLRGSRDVYFVLTCGDGAGNAQKYARTLCDALKLNCKGLSQVIMPENYVAMFPVPDEENAKRIVRNAEPAIREIADSIHKGGTLKKRVTIADRVLSAVVNPVFYALYVKDRKFRTGEGCTGCGMCARICPMNNITVENKRPVWHGNCTHCMACICRCPAEAIEYGKASKGKPRYTCPRDE